MGLRSRALPQAAYVTDMAWIWDCCGLPRPLPSLRTSMCLGYSFKKTKNKNKKTQCIQQELISNSRSELAERKEKSSISTHRDSVGAVWLGPPRPGNILSTGFFPLPTHSSPRVSLASSPRNEPSLRGLDRESGTAMADCAETEPGSGTPAFSQPTH